MDIGLIGDFIEDIYVYGKVDRISPESPIPIFNETNRDIRPGGAGNVQANLKALGSKVISYGSTNSKKTRFVCDNHILFRSDDEVYTANHQTEYNFDGCNIVILSDYNKGYLHNSRVIIENLRRQGKLVIVDPKSSLDNYYGSDIIKLNLSELHKYSNSIDLSETRDLYNIGTLIVTRGSDSVLLLDNLGLREVATGNHQVSDVTGAGDIFIASLAHFLSQGTNIDISVQKATALASISVTKFGTYILSQADINSISPKIVFGIIGFNMNNHMSIYILIRDFIGIGYLCVRNGNFPRGQFILIQAQTLNTFFPCCPIVCNQLFICASKVFTNTIENNIGTIVDGV